MVGVGYYALGSHSLTFVAGMLCDWGQYNVILFDNNSSVFFPYYYVINVLNLSYYVLCDVIINVMNQCVWVC